VATSDPMVRAIAIEAQLYALYRHLKGRGVLDDSDMKSIAIDAQESVTHLSNRDEVVEEIRNMTGVRPHPGTTKL
jgi:hypothetical protein